MTTKSVWRGATAIGLSLALLAGCAPTPEPPPPPPPPAPAPPPPPPPPPVEIDWRDRELTPGDWSYRRDGDSIVATYGTSGAAPQFTVRCEMPARQIRFERAGAIEGSDGTMAFQTTETRNSYRAANLGGAGGMIAAQTRASDPFLDHIAFSRGRISVSVTGQSMLILPNWPEMIRVFEDCRG